MLQVFPKCLFFFFFLPVLFPYLPRSVCFGSCLVVLTLEWLSHWIVSISKIIKATQEHHFRPFLTSTLTLLPNSVGILAALLLIKSRCSSINCLLDSIHPFFSKTIHATAGYNKQHLQVCWDFDQFIYVSC